MIRKSGIAWMVVGLALFCAGAQAAFGQFSSVAVAVNAPKIGLENQLVARVLDMKEGFTIGKSYSVYDGKPVYPVVNLDIFYVYVERSGRQRVGSSKPEDPQGDITVVIPFSDIAKAATRTGLVFWDPDGKKWLSAKDLSKEIGAVGKVDAGGGYFYIKVKDWPIDDRIIGCY